ncbi:MAG: hypothetical protein ACYSU7_17640, partial [Planctomycetota bacterium]
RMSRSLLVWGVLVTSATGLAGTAHAESIFVENASFESLVITDGTWDLGAPEGWTLLGGKFGVFNPTVTTFPGGVPDGNNSAYSNGGTITQVLAAVLEPDTVYSLAVDLGNRPETDFPGYQVQLWAGGELIADDDSSFTPAGQNFESSLVTFLALPDDPRLGQSLEIRLVSLGIQVNYDNVTLNGTLIPTPGALALLCVAGLVGWRRRR